MRRRAFLLMPSVLLACKRERRCSHCGMRIDEASAWRTELVAKDGSVAVFDTPRCAFTSWRSGATPATSLRAQDYYERAWRPASELRFVLGGDVIGPMGPDLVPVAPTQVAKFVQDHNGDRALTVDEVTLDTLRH